MVESATTLPNVTVPAPLTLLHCDVTPVPGTPSSVTMPTSDTALVGNVIAWSGPAFTTGGRFATPVAVTVM